MYKKIIAAILLAAILIILGRIVHKSGMLRSIQTITSGKVLPPWENVLGPEDLDLVKSYNHLIISSTDRRSKSNPADGLYRVALNDSFSLPVKIISDYPGTLHPHGIYVLNQDSISNLFVVNHQENGDAIEQFHYNGINLSHQRSYKHPLMQGANDIVALNENEFYLTRDHGAEKEWTKTLEDYLLLPWAKVIYFNGESFSEAASGLTYANGINVSSDGQKLYVTETTGRKLNIYNIHQDGSLSESAQVGIPTGLDNINLDNKDRLWIGCHPQLLKFTKHAKDKGFHSPSEIILVDPRDNYAWETVILDDGSSFSGCSSALLHQGVLYAGVVFDPIVWRTQINR